MKRSSLWSALGYAGLMLMSGIWIGYGYVILHDRSFTKSYRFTQAATEVDGAPAVFMALLLMSLGAIALAVVSGRLGAPKYLRVLVFLATLGPAVFYLSA